MKTRFRLLILFGAATLIALIVWQAVATREPVYRGRPLHEWLELAQQNDLVYPPSEEAIRAMGADAVPHLLKLVATKDSNLRQSFLELQRSQSWIPIQIRPQKDLQEMGVYGFTVLSGEARSAASALAGLLNANDSQVRAGAAFSLSKLGISAPNAAPAVAAYLHGLVARGVGVPTDALEKACAASALAEFGMAARPAIPDLTALTNDVKLEVKSSARAALIRLRGDSLQSIRDALHDTANLTNWLAAGGVVSFLGTNAAPVIPELLFALSQSNSVIQNEAIRLLGKVHSQAEVCLPALLPFLQVTNPWTRADCLSSLRAFGPQAGTPAVISEVKQHLTDPDAWVRRQATNALRKIDPAATFPSP